MRADGQVTVSACVGLVTRATHIAAVAPVLSGPVLKARVE